MALQPCRECARELSTEATACPHCGAPRPRADAPAKHSGSDKAVGFVALLGAVLFFAVCTAVGREQSNRPAAAYSIAPAATSPASGAPVASAAAGGDSARAVAACEGAVRDTLGSRVSAEFTASKRVFRRTRQPRSFVVGGEVTAVTTGDLAVIRGFVCGVDVGENSVEVGGPIFTDRPRS